MTASKPLGNDTMANETDKILEFMRAQFDRTNGLAFEREERTSERFDKLDARFDKIDARLDSVDARIDRLTSTVEKLAENVAGLDSSMVGVLQHVSNANAAHARTEREINGLRSRIEELERRVFPAT
jgi:chromosome segregation ATPase